MLGNGFDQLSERKTLQVVLGLVEGRQRVMKEVPTDQQRWTGDTISSSIWRYICLLLSCFCVAPGATENTEAMSSKKKGNRKSSGQSKAKKFNRSLSMSPERTPQEAIVVSSRRRTVTYRPPSAVDYLEKYLNYESTRLTPFGNSTCKGEKFPIQKLPTDCKLKVFAFLSPEDRGRAAKVCREWNQLIKTSSLWNNVNLTTFPYCHNSKKSHQCGPVCYDNYRLRMKSFMTFLQTVQPALRTFSFAYDIGDKDDQWLTDIQHLMRRARFQDLEFANLNWKETPMKHLWCEHITWSVNEYNELMQRHRHRQRIFVNFFEMFTSAAPNVVKLILPFEWSARSLRALSRLQRLDTLVLEKYFVFQIVSQASVDQLFASVPNLHRLILEVWTPSAKGLQLYKLKAQNLEYLDISQSRGFYLESVDLPNLQVFKVCRHPWSGPITMKDSVPMPCLYDLLKRGTPKLRQINEHTLRPDWRDVSYEELEVVFKAVCSCQAHKTGWVM